MCSMNASAAIQAGLQIPACSHCDDWHTCQPAQESVDHLQAVQDHLFLCRLTCMLLIATIAALLVLWRSLQMKWM